MGNLTQAELANKYEIGQGTVSIVLRLYNVPSTGYVPSTTSNRAKRVYSEKEAVYAFRAYFRNKAEDLRKKAREIEDRSDKFIFDYERNYVTERLEETE